MENDYLEELRRKVGKPWPEIEKARQDAIKKRNELSSRLTENGVDFTSSDARMVVFGSLARDEWTSKSDVDWTLLIDGQVNPFHRDIAQRISAELEKVDGEKPGTTGTFGSMTFSHDIVHLIGGHSDTNINTTQRMLLLLESAPIPNGDSANAYQRVLKSILNRYLRSDTNFVYKTASGQSIPRFLLNDIVRFWRTMCVDFAFKKNLEQGEKKWALRNIKLRMSRKLIFVSGLLMCAVYYLKPVNIELSSMGHNDFDNRDMEPLLSPLLELSQMTPLQVVARAVIEYGSVATGEKLFDAYDWFLGMLNDDAKRKKLAEMKPKDACCNPLFDECREYSHQFQGALTDLFFNDNDKLNEFTITYGVF